MEPETYHEKLKGKIDEYVHFAHTVTQDFPKEESYKVHKNFLEISYSMFHVSRFMFHAALLSTFYLLLSGIAVAAGGTVFMENEPKIPAQGREFVVSLFVSSDQPLNGYDISVSFRPNDVELIRTDTARSLIDVWPKQPLIYRSGDVRWSGASIKPFVGERGELLALHLRALPGVTSTILSIRRETALYLANGKGTKIMPRSQELAISFTPSANSGEQPPGGVPAEPTDNAPPDITFLALEKDPITPGQKLLSFQTNDRQSGIANIEARTRSWFFWSDWQPARNPNALTAGVWEAELRITDYAGNVARKAIHDWGTVGAKVAILFLATIIVGALVIHAIMRYRRRREG